MSASISAKPRRRRGLRLVLLLILLLGAWVGVEALMLPDVSPLANTVPQSTAFIDLYREQKGSPPAWSWVPYAEIPLALKQAVLVAEDHKFMTHDGFSFDEMKRASAEAVDQRETPRGASTITQQLARNLYLSPDRTLRRKLREALLTLQIESDLDKRRILEIYLNVVELGPGIYGVEAASQRYFGTSVRQINEEQATALAASLPDPESWHPGSTDPEYVQRLAALRERMGKLRELNVLSRIIDS